MNSVSLCELCGYFGFRGRKKSVGFIGLVQCFCTGLGYNEVVTSQLLRIFEIDRRVRAKKKPTPSELGRDLGVSRRQIFYDRDRLIELGAPLLCEKGGWVYRDECFVLPTSVLTEGELLAFFLAVEIARAVDGAFAAELTRTIEKLRCALRVGRAGDSGSQCAFANHFCLAAFGARRQPKLP